jgi:uncharacterized protein YjaG (DUF416 family)
MSSIYNGIEATTGIRLPTPKPPRYSLDYVAHDGDSCNFRPQIEIHATIGYDLDENAIEIRSVTVNTVAMYSRPDYRQGREVPFTDAELAAHVPFVRAAVNADEAWRERALESAIEADRCGDGDF